MTMSGKIINGINYIGLSESFPMNCIYFKEGLVALHSAFPHIGTVKIITVTVTPTIEDVCFSKTAEMPMFQNWLYSMQESEASLTVLIKFFIKIKYTDQTHEIYTLTMTSLSAKKIRLPKKINNLPAEVFTDRYNYIQVFVEDIQIDIFAGDSFSLFASFFVNLVPVK